MNANENTSEDTSEDTSPAPAPDTEQGPEQEPELPPYSIEPARSSRSKCRTCRRKIEKGELRIGVLLEGPYGTGYLWHHLKCAARRRFEDVAAAYDAKAWAEGVEVPALDSLEKLKEEAEKQKAEKKELPHAERDPSGRAKCKCCDEKIEKGSWRVVMGRNVEFYGQVRMGPVNVHARCVQRELDAEDTAHDPEEDFAALLRQHSGSLSTEELDEVVAEAGLDS